LFPAGTGAAPAALRTVRPRQVDQQRPRNRFVHLLQESLPLIATVALPTRLWAFPRCRYGAARPRLAETTITAKPSLSPGRTRSTYGHAGGSIVASSALTSSMVRSPACGPVTRPSGMTPNRRLPLFGLIMAQTVFAASRRAPVVLLNSSLSDYLLRPLRQPSRRLSACSALLIFLHGDRTYRQRSVRPQAVPDGNCLASQPQEGCAPGAAASFGGGAPTVPAESCPCPVTFECGQI